MTLSLCLVPSMAYADEPVLTARLSGLDVVAGDQFGESVALSGSTLVVGADDDDTFATLAGSVHVFEKVGPNGTKWEQTHQLIGSDTLTKDRFGSGVAIDGDLLVVGAQGVNGDVQNAVGAAYLFERDGNGDWIEKKKFLPHVEFFSTYFGDAVAISGNTLVIGASNGEGSFNGNVSIYERDEGGLDNWGLVQRLTGHGGTDFFGISVAIEDDTLVVGASAFTGAVYIYERDQGGPNNWGQVAKRVGPSQAGIGESVAVSGDLVVAGTSDQNTAYVFGRDQEGPGAWGLIKALQNPNGSSFDRFGHAVAISGTVVVVGDELDDEKGQNSGAITFFEQDEGGPNNWGPTQTLTPPDLESEDRMGNELAMEGNVVVVGTAWDDTAFIYETKTPTVDFEVGGDCPTLVTRLIDGLTPNWIFRMYWSDSEGTSFVPDGDACGGLELGLENPIVVSTNFADDRGAESRSFTLNPNLCGTYLQVVDAFTCTPSSVEQVPLEVVSPKTQK